MNALTLQPADRTPKRRRSFVAGTAEPPAAAPAGSDEIPILTEVVPADAVVAHATSASATPSPPPVDTAALARELEAWLDEELPQHVMRVLDGVTDQLIYRIAAHARADLLQRLKDAVDAPTDATGRSDQEPA